MGAPTPKSVAFRSLLVSLLTFCPTSGTRQGGGAAKLFRPCGHPSAEWPGFHPRWVSNHFGWSRGASPFFCKGIGVGEDRRRSLAAVQQVDLADEVPRSLV